MASLHIQLYLSTPEKYPARQHARRVATQLGCPNGLLYLVGQYGFNMEDSDLPKTWRQRRYFYYCSGVDIPNCCVTYDMKKDELILYVPEVKWDGSLWMGRGPTVKEAEEKYDVDAVRINSELFSDLKRWRDQHSLDTFYILHPDAKPDIELPRIDSTKLIRAIDCCRVIKSPYEVKLIRHANAITAKAHTAVLRNIHRYKNEAQIAGVFQDVCISHQARQSYPIIAGSGANAAILHYSTDNEPLNGKQLVCLDAGAEFQLYTSDVTRTFPISGTYTEEAKAIYATVQEMQESCISTLKPGVKMIDLDRHCHAVLVVRFLKLGIFHCGTAEEILKAGTSSAFYPHGLGHHVGLDVHDCQTLQYEQVSEPESGCAWHTESAAVVPPHVTAAAPPLEAGMVITIEPGIYFNRPVLERHYLSSPVHSKFINESVLDNYCAVGGVRIEDDILITEDGYENLTTTPKGEEALAHIREGIRRCTKSKQCFTHGCK